MFDNAAYTMQQDLHYGLNSILYIRYYKCQEIGIFKYGSLNYNVCIHFI